MEFHKESEATESPTIQGGGLPHEALFLVLSYLHVYELLAMTQVCRSLREALKNDVLPWLNFVVTKPLNKRLNNEHLLKLTSKAHGRLKTLALLNCSKITDDGLQKVVAANPLITRLCLPACTSLTPSAVIEAVQLLGKNNQRLKSLSIRGIYNIKKEDLVALHDLIDDENQPRQKKQELNLYHSHYNDFSTFHNSAPAIDVDMCPACDQVRPVFDCPRDCGNATTRHQQKMECRGCIFCIPRCVECGICFNEKYPLEEEVACADSMCLRCWFRLPKCSFCNRPYCTVHADEQHSLSGSSSGWVCAICHALYIENPCQDDMFPIPA